MTFVSFAQNLEDVMLWRALKHVQNGFYIDVGANDPSIDSVTRAFYERDWRGINIEPLPSHHKDLLAQRPYDTNLRCAAGSEKGKVEIWECDVRGWATASTDVIAQHSANGHEGVFHKVPVRTLSDICSQYVAGEIHFLKIDVEGFEKPVIDGMDFSRFRPWILVIEATRPNSTEEVYQEWESDLVVAGYVFAYADGLNRFYVAREHADLLEVLRYPPNVFDDFIRSQQLDSELKAQRAEGKIESLSADLAHKAAQQAAVESRAQVAEAQAESRAQVAEARVKEAEAELAVVRNELHEVHQTSHHHWQQWETTKQELQSVHQSNHHHHQLAEARQQTIHALQSSWSWRVTAPLRWAASPFMDRERPGAVSPELTFADRAIRWAMAQPRLVAAVHKVVDLLPPVRDAITSRVGRSMHPTLRSYSQAVDRQATQARQMNSSVRSVPTFAQEAPHNVDEILDRIRAELRRSKRDE